MNPDELLAHAAKKGIRLWAEGNRLRYQGPSSQLTPEVLAQLSQHKTELIARLGEKHLAGPASSRPIEHLAQRKVYPLSFAQQRLWFLEQLEPGASVYNMPVAWQLEGELRAKELRWAMEALARRHEVLRTRVEVVEGEARAAVDEKWIMEWREEDLRGVEPPAWKERLREESRRPLDLARGPLWRGGIMRVGEERHVLWLVMHHMIGDAWSLGIMEGELRRLYESRLRGENSPALAPLSLQYGDYAVWQREWLVGEELERQMRYWKERLQDASVLELPVDGLREARHAGGRYRREMGRETLERIRSMSRESGVTLFMSFLGGLALMLSRSSGQKKVVVGTPIANRTREELEGLVGFFANTLALALEVREDERVRDYLARVREEALGAYEHQDVPFEKLVEELSPERDLGRHPLFQVMLVWQNAPREMEPMAGMTLKEVEVERGTAKFDLEVALEEMEGGKLLLVVEYATGLFEERTIDLMIDHWLELMDGLAANPEGRIRDLPNMQSQRLVLASTFTAEPIEETIQFWMKQLDFPWQIAFAPYNQVFQQLLDPASLLMSNTHGANTILVQFNDWRREAESASGPEAPEARVEEATRDLIRALKSALPRMKVPCLLCLCSAGDQAAATSQEETFFGRMEDLLEAELGGLSGLVLIRSGEIDALYPVSEKHDPHGDALGHVPFTPEYFTAVGSIIARRLYALKHPPYKVIVSDCDQTLWGGRCGEDGPAGVVMDAHRTCLQRFLAGKIQEGFLVCLCSKNNEEEVFQTFKANPDMPLTLDSLVNWRINWRPKSENLRSLAAELNLGLDSFVFLDDDSLECEEVRRHCPEVLVLQMPLAEAEIPRFLNHAWAFDRIRVTAEDQQRTQLYQQDRQRAQLEKEALNFSEFLESLKVSVSCQPLAPEDLPRAAQLTQRTNQFNASTRRRTELELEQFLQNEGHEGWIVHVQDRFGDYGLVGLMLTVSREDRLWVDTFLLSCRALGRGVEHQMLAWLGQRAQYQELPLVEIPCQPNAKNRPAVEFLESTGSEYRTGSEQEWIILYPAAIAAQTVFRPPESRHNNKAQEVKKNGAPAAAPSSARPHSHRLHRIPHELFDVKRIQERIQVSRPQIRRKSEGFMEPRTDVEKILASIWAEVLGVDQVGAHDNFFHLGGHSLMATRMLSQVARIFQVQPTLKLVFESPTLAAFAEGLIQAEPQAGQIEKIARIYLAINAMSEEEQEAYLSQMQ